MSSQQIKLVKSTWFLFRNIDPKLVGDVFYSKLFFDYPQLRPMFPKKMADQYEKLIQMLNTIVAGLEDIEALGTAIGAMAERHTGYGVRPEHYDAVGEALLWTLEQGLRTDWNEAVKDAWLTCYTILAQAMINAGNPKME